MDDPESSPLESVVKILYALAFLSALASVFFQLNQMTEWFFLFKPLTTILIIGALLLFGSRARVRFYYAMLSGLCACLLGDIFLLDDTYFVCGLGAFLAGHLLFVYAFVSLGGFKRYPLPLIIIAVIALTLYIHLLPSLGSFSVPVAVYVSVIVVMVWQGVSLILWRKTRVTVSIGVAAILFMVSDSVIAINKFLFPFDTSSAVVLPTYWLSIGLLSYSANLLKKDAINVA